MADTRKRNTTTKEVKRTIAEATHRLAFEEEALRREGMAKKTARLKAERETVENQKHRP